MELLISDSVITPNPYEISFSVAAKKGGSIYTFNVSVYPYSRSWHVQTPSATPLEVFDEFMDSLIRRRPALGWLLDK